MSLKSNTSVTLNRFFIFSALIYLVAQDIQPSGLLETMIAVLWLPVAILYWALYAELINKISREPNNKNREEK